MMGTGWTRAAWRVCRDQAVAGPHSPHSLSLPVKESSQGGSGAQTALPRPLPPPSWHLQLQRPQSGESPGKGEEAEHVGLFLQVSRGQQPQQGQAQLVGESKITK